MNRPRPISADAHWQRILGQNLRTDADSKISGSAHFWRPARGNCTWGSERRGRGQPTQPPALLLHSLLRNARRRRPISAKKNSLSGPIARRAYGGEGDTDGRRGWPAGRGGYLPELPSHQRPSPACTQHARRPALKRSKRSLQRNQLTVSRSVVHTSKNQRVQCSPVPPESWHYRCSGLRHGRCSDRRRYFREVVQSGVDALPPDAAICVVRGIDRRLPAAPGAVWPPSLRRISPPPPPPPKARLTRLRALLAVAELPCRLLPPCRPWPSLLPRSTAKISRDCSKNRCRHSSSVTRPSSRTSRRRAR